MNDRDTVNAKLDEAFYACQATDDPGRRYACLIGTYEGIILALLRGLPHENDYVVDSINKAIDHVKAI